MGLAVAALFALLAARSLPLGVRAYLALGWLPLDVIPLAGNTVVKGLRPAQILASLLVLFWLVQRRRPAPGATRPGFVWALWILVPLSLVSGVVGYLLPDPAIDARNVKVAVGLGQVMLLVWPIAILEAVSDSVRTSADIAKTLDILLWPAPLSLILPLLPKDLARFLDFTQYFALFAAPFALAWLLTGNRRWPRLWLLVTAVAPCIIGVLVGRAFFYGAWAVSMATVVVLYKRQAAAALIPLAAAAIVLSFALSSNPALPGPLSSLVEREVAQQSLGGRSGRLAILEDALSIWTTAPVFGVGPGNSWPYMHRYSVIDTPHNQYANVLLELGAIGLLAFGVFVGGAIAFTYRAWRRSRSAEHRVLLLGALGGLCGLAAGSVVGDFIIHSIRNDGLALFSQYYPQWIILGLVLAIARLDAVARREA